MPQDIHALVREQVRLIVDPLILKLRTELYGENGVYGPYLAAGKISPQVIQEGAQVVVDDMAADGDIVKAYVSFTADSNGIQTGKVVSYNGAVASEADCTSYVDAGQIIGIATGPAGPGEIVRVQTYGILQLTGDTWSFGSTGSVLCGEDGHVVFELPSGALWAQHVGVVLSPTSMFVMIQPDPYLF